MGTRKKAEESPIQRRRPAISREARQAHLENLALDLLEKRFMDGSASSQEVTLYARSASTRGRLEEKKIEAEVALAAAKEAHLKSQEELQNLFKDAIAAMGRYKMDDEEGVGGPNIQ